MGVKVEDYIEIIRPYVKELFKNDSSGHDIGHLERTMKLALDIQKIEGGDRLVIGIAAFLHDIHRIMQSEKRGKFVSPEESLPKVREILSHTDLKKEIIDKICFCIEYHEHYNWNGNNVKDLDALILQDADNLDATGAIGIGRAFSYGGAYNVSMYDENLPLNSNSDYKEHSDIKETTIHYMYHKIFNLANYMNTKTAKREARRRIRFMKKYSDEFLKEWNARILINTRFISKRRIRNT